MRCEHASPALRVVVERLLRGVGLRGAGRGLVLVALAREQHEVVALKRGHARPERLRRREACACIERHGELLRCGLRRSLREPAARIEVDARLAPGEPELGVVDADLSEKTLQRIRAAGRQRDTRDVALGAVLGEARQALVERGVRALRDAGDLDLAPPLSDLDDERNLVADGHVLERELARRVGRRDGNGLAGDGGVAAVAGLRAVRNVGERRVRYVHGRVVDGHLARRVVDGAAHRGLAAVVTRDLLAFEADASRLRARVPHSAGDSRADGGVLIAAAAASVERRVVVAATAAGRGAHRHAQHDDREGTEESSAHA